MPKDIVELNWISIELMFRTFLLHQLCRRRKFRKKKHLKNF